MAVATLVIGFCYGLLPEALRFSRALLILGGLSGITVLISWRSVIGFLTGKHLFHTSYSTSNECSILGSDSGEQKLQKLLAENGIVPAFFLQDQVATNATVDLEEVAAKIRLYSINECIIESTAWPTSTLMKING